MIAGIGCRSGVSANQVEAAIDAAVAALQGTARTLTAIATPAGKAHEPGIKAAAASRGVPLMLISQEALEAANPSTVTRSDHSMAAMNVYSVAEAAALAGATALADAAPRSPQNPHLLAARVAVGPVTCALADTAPATSATATP
jgi:cobalt-precorrin 5A hydrolase